MTQMKYDKQWICATIERNCMTNFGYPIAQATDAQKYRALALTVKDQIMELFALSRGRREQVKARKVYYLSMEFLIGRLLSNNMLNLNNLEQYQQACGELGIDLAASEDFEPEPGLGNGGLGRLAACFMDSLTSLSLPAMGCTIRYELGLFRQKIVDGQQVEMPDNWLIGGNIWEVCVPEDTVEVHFYGRVEQVEENGRVRPRHVGYSTVLAVPYDVPVVGYGAAQVNRLRLWSAKAPEAIDMRLFNEGDYTRMMDERDLAEVISKVLYPEDRHNQGKELRLRQQYFLSSATMQYIIADFRRNYGDDLHRLPDYVAIQINDTHPALSIPELMRILLDDYDFSWEDAMDVCKRTFSYTNHTVLAEALERWGVDIFKTTLPRIYEIVCALNETLCRKLWNYFPGQWDRIAHMAVVAYDQVHMANLCCLMSGAVNGVSKLHAEILKKDTFRDFYLIEPEKYFGITNGITHRRWLMDANPALSALLDETIGQAWRRDPQRLSDLTAHADDKAFLEQFRRVKTDNKIRLSNYLLAHQGEMVDPESIYDVQAKRIHEYKRQLMNILHVMYLYNRICDDANFTMTPKTYFFGGKAAPGYVRAKLILQLITHVAALIARHPRASRMLKVVFLENYCVSNAEILIPAADVSEQISTAGKEASGTGNMKFMMNGALTCGTLDGANVEITQCVGRNNIYLFGLTAEEVSGIYSHGNYRAGEIFESDPAIRRIMEQLIDGTLCPPESKLFSELYHYLIFGYQHQIADPYLCLRDFDSYRTIQAKISQDYANQALWSRKAALNTACSGYFSSDRTIGEYNDRIWKLKPIEAYLK